MKVGLRFWRNAEILEDKDGSFLLHLDGKPAKTPASKPFLLPTYALGQAIAAEWQAQEKKIEPHTMPLTQLASTAIDRVGLALENVIDHLLSYADSDLLCCRAPHPEALQERQKNSWQPILEWLDQHHNVKLMPTDSLAATQSKEAKEKLKVVLKRFDLFELSAIAWATQITGSIALALALVEKRLTAQACFDLAELDTLWQIEKWGEDAEATKRLTRVHEDLIDTERFLILLK